MKRIIYYIFVLFIGVGFFTSCEEGDITHDPIEYGNAPAFTSAITTSNISDSAFTVTFTPSVKGYIYYVIQDTAAADLTADEVINSGTSITVDNAEEQYTVTPTELDPTHMYEIFAVHANEQGVASDLHEKVTVKTTDTYSPVLMGLSPAPSLDGYFDPYGAGISADASLLLQFNEPVYYDSDYNVTISDLFGLMAPYTVPADSIMTDGNIVTINHPTLPYQDIIFVSVDSAAFNDGNGNVWSGISSYEDGGYVYGWYYGTGPNPDNVLANIFGNFQGSYESTSYDVADSTTVLHTDTVTVTQSTEDGYMVTISDFNGIAGASATLEFKESGSYKYIVCPEQEIDADHYVEARSDVWGDHGQWMTSDYSFNIDLVVRAKATGAIVEEVHNEYLPISAKKSAVKRTHFKGIPYKFLYE